VIAANLRADAFFAGDPGVKLIAARNALAHPLRPLEIPLPTIGGSAAPFVEPFFVRHGDHTHAIASELFPLLTAPLIGLFGLRGAYVLPAVGFLVAIGAIAALGKALDARRDSQWTAIVAVLATPFLFYGLELWEHMPAVALGASAAVLTVRGVTQRSSRRACAAGALFVVATLLRPEAAWFAVAVLLACGWLDPRPSWRTVAAIVAGGALVAAPFELYALQHFGTLIPPHVSTNLDLLNETWGTTRAAFVRLWFLSNRNASIWRATPAIVIALAAPFRRPARRGSAFLWTAAALDAVVVLLTAPNDGGAQWGPRYLLFAYVPLVVLAADAIPSARRASFTTTEGRSGTRRLFAAALVLLVLAVGGWSERAAYRTLQRTKAEYGRLVDALGAAVPAGGTVVTDVWWLDQAAAALSPRAQFLYADDDRESIELTATLQAAFVSPVVRVTSRTSPHVTTWGDGCPAQTAETLAIADLVMRRLDCRR
jgi:hypothetical protein